MSTKRLMSLVGEYQAATEDALDVLLPPPEEASEQLHRAMRYSALGGGKRVRASLVFMAGALTDADVQDLRVPAAAVEMLHAYSLIHDDLPAMDDDDLRRGRPSCHKAFDEATAILAGDALQTQAFIALTEWVPRQVPPDQQLAITGALAVASGSLGMAGGQAIDLESEGENIGLAALEAMHRRKTGALIRAAVEMGLRCGPGVAPAVLQHLDRYAAAIGLSFQIHDDVLDITSDTETLGKAQGADVARGKSTYPALLGLDAAIARARAMHEEAIASLEGLGSDADPLRWLSEYIITRVH